MPNFTDTSHSDNCLFCQIVSGGINSVRVYEDHQVIAIMDVGPVNPGHVLVLPKEHYTNLFELPTDVAQHVMAVAQRIAIAVRDAFRCPGLMLLQANGKEGEQTVLHFHMHVVPRHADDGAGLVWPRKQPSGEELAGHAQLIAERL